jgi:hypothetical protein
MPKEITLTHYRAILASPSDVKSEREIANSVIEQLNRETSSPMRSYIELVRWETHVGPGFHPDGPQGRIDPILQIEDADLFISVFWHTFGTTTQDGTTGTEHEFLKAYKSWKSFQRPQIMFYFNDKSYSPRNSTEASQWARVLDFKEAFPSEGLWWKYKGGNEFGRLLKSHLEFFIRSQQTDERRFASNRDFNLGLSNLAWVETRLIDLLDSPAFYEIVQKLNRLAPAFVRLLMLKQWDQAELYLRSCGLGEFDRKHYMSVGREAIAFTDVKLQGAR